jgi:hypothetical protein
MNPLPYRHPDRKMSFPRFARTFAVAGLIFLAAAVTGCSVLKLTKSVPKAEVASSQLTDQTGGPITFPELQQRVMRFADTYVAMIAQACDEASATATNSNTRLVLLRWKLGQASSAYNNATGQNPAVNTLDMLVLVSMARMVVQDYGMTTYGDVIQPLLAAQCQLETNAWDMAKGVLKPSQEQELRNLITEWRRKNPNQRYIGPVRFREFATALGRPPTQSPAPTSIFSLLYIDPLAGLDPTAAAIQETRELGERAMYYTQRMPGLLSWQAEVLTYQVADQPASQQVLIDVDRLAASTQIFAKTAQQLPQLINDQRQAAIQQILDGLTAQAGKAQDLLGDTRSTLNSTSDAAKNINDALKSLTAFVQYVSPTNAPPAPTNSKPFNVLDYGTAAAQIGAAARDLNATLQTLNQSMPGVTRLGQQTTADADRLVLRMFWLSLVLIVVLLAGAVVAGLVYHRLKNKANPAGS